MYLDAIRADSAALASAARKGLDARVPACPEWDVERLLRHLGRVHRWATEIVRTRATERVDSRGIKPGDDDDLIEWFERGADTLVVTLEAADPDEAVWGFGQPPNNAAFWRRRQAQETTVHRWDGESAHGIATPIDADLAIDGIDEMFDVFTRWRIPEGASLGGSLHLHATDRDGEWLVRVDKGRVEVTREHAKGDAAVRGTASDLLLFLWNRIPAADLEVFGEAEVARRWSDIKI